MDTTYSDIHSVFLSKITDYDILKFMQVEREEILDAFLRSSIIKFKKTCLADLSNRDDVLRKFNIELDEDTIEILALGELYYWICPKVLNTDVLKNHLNTKEFTMYSPAKLLSELKDLKQILHEDFRKEIIIYSYNNADFKDLKVGG